jgi:branched-chain amino acid transport system ATP-binding protein
VLEVRGLSKSFGGFRAVSDVDLAVAEGEIAAVIGPNGAGKSTLFNLITGHLQPTAGRVLVNGRDVTGVAPYKICGIGIGRSFQRTNIFPKLTVLENVRAALLAYHGQGLNFWSRANQLCHREAETLLASIGLAGQAQATSGTLSYGNQKQLELGIALASDPNILLLDEPTAGMSASETHETIALIERIARERRLTLLFTEHDMAVVFSIAQKISVMHQGRVIAHGDPAAVRADAQVRRVYLGDEPMRPRS